MPIQRITSGILADGAILATDIADGIVTNAKLAGSITSDKITSVSNTAIAGLIQSAQIGSVSNTALPTGSVLQVVSTTKTDTFTTASGSDVAITGLSASITPSSASNKILILANIGASGTTDNDATVFFSLYKSASVISGAVGPAAGSRKVCTSASRSSINTRYQSTGIMFLDSPSSTSSLTYQIFCSTDGGTGCINRSGDDSDSTSRPRTISSITVMEIAG